MHSGDGTEPSHNSVGQQSGIEAPAHDALRPVVKAFFLKRVGDAHEVDDLTQEVFLRLVRRGGFGPEDNLVGYALRTAQSVWLDRARYRRSREADRHVTFDPDIHAEADWGTEQAVFARDGLRHAAIALEDLPERTRHVFLLRRVDGLTMQDIADRLGISLSSAEKHLRRAALQLVKLRRRSQ